MAEAGEHRSRAKEILAIVARVVDEVNLLAPQAQTTEFEAVKGTLVQRAKKEQEGPLKPLPGVQL